MWPFKQTIVTNDWSMEKLLEHSNELTEVNDEGDQMSTEIGDVGELKAQMYFLQKGFEVYAGNVGNTYYDFIAINARHVDTPVVYKIEVKSTTTRNKANTGWTFNIRKSFGDVHFDKTKVDYLCCYIEPIDKLFVVKASEVKQKREYLITDKQLGDVHL